MSLIHGRVVSSEEVERIISREFNATRFASLSNSIAWASAGKRCSSLPSFTERVNARDGGVDALWQIELAAEGQYSSPLLGPGVNVFQYKQRDIFAAGRARTFQRLEAGLKGAMRELHESTSTRPDRYILFTNLDLVVDQKESLRTAIVDGYDEAEKIEVVVVGAAEISAFLNDLPHIRSAAFATSKFRTWDAALAAHASHGLFAENLGLIGRDDDITSLRALLDDADTRVIALCGPHQVGKTRLALEATSSRPFETVEALDSRSLTPSELLDLLSPNREVVAVLNDPDPEKLSDLVGHALDQRGLKLILTIPTTDPTTVPSFGRDKRVRIVDVKGLDDKQSETLLRSSKANFDYSVQSWVVDQAGGIPGVLLFAASVSNELRNSSGDFVTQVGEAFESRVRKILGDDAIEALRAFSVLTHVGVKGERLVEISRICEAIGIPDGLNRILNSLRRLHRAGLLRGIGLYVEVLPPIFANYLASSALRGRFVEFVGLFAALDGASRVRLLRRLRVLKGEEVSRFWAELLGPGGLLSDLDSALNNSRLMHLLAGTVPDRIADVIERGLQRLTVEQRRNIRGTERRGLVWTIEELLFRRQSCEAALRCLILLAEAENETWGNNATGMLCESFHPMHPQIPLTLEKRLAILRDMLSEAKSIEIRKLGVQAVQSAVKRHGIVTLRRSAGPDPLDARPTMTWGEIWAYLDQLIELLMGVSHSSDPSLAQAACAELPHALFEGAIQLGNRPERSVERFDRVVEELTGKRLAVSATELATCLRQALDNFKREAQKADEKTRGTLSECVRKLEAAKAKLDSADFTVRFKRWLGGWTPEDHEREHEGAPYRIEREIRSLANEVIQNPSSLTTDLLGWVSSEEAKKAHNFFWVLGKLDEQKQFSAIIETLGTQDGGQGPFANYCGGQAQVDKTVVSEWLDRLANEGSVRPEAIVRATVLVGGEEPNVSRIVALLREHRVEPLGVAAVVVMGGFFESMATESFLLLAHSIAGPDFRNASVVTKLVHFWLYAGKSLEPGVADLAWHCIESANSVSINNSYEFDEVATRLAEADLNRAFELLEVLLRSPHDRNAWNPVGHFARHRFWTTVCEADPNRAFRIIFHVAQANARTRVLVSWELSDVIDQTTNSNILISLAREDEQMAEIIAESLSAAKEGFWPIALSIVEKYPTNERVRSALTSGADHSGTVITDSYAVHMERCRAEVERVLLDPQTPSAAKPWLEHLQSSFKLEAERELLSEADHEVNELREVANDPNAPERLWAVQTLIRHGKLRRLRGLIPKEEVLSLLGQLALPAEQLNMIRAEVQGW